MNLALWSTIGGLLLISMVLSATLLQRLPLSSSMIYLLVGIAISPLCFDLVSTSLTRDAALIEHVSEVVVLISLFTSGLKLSAPIGNWRWTLPARLATTSMVATVVGIVVVGIFFLHLAPGAAVLLAGILAPTDPVLASDVQVDEPGDRDRLRFALTGEGGLNDGTAFPVVVLGLGILGLRDLGTFGWHWFTVDVLWAVASGLASGALVGAIVGGLVLYLRRRHQEAVGLDNFIALGTIALSYGLALSLEGYGFLAVFAAGCAFRRVERLSTMEAASQGAEEEDAPAPNVEDDGVMDEPGLDAAPRETANANTRLEPEIQKAVDPSTTGPSRKTLDDLATHETKAGVYMAHAVLTFNEQIERIGEVVAVVIIGALLWSADWSQAPWWFPVLILFIIRPVATHVGLVRSVSSRRQRWLIGWFGIRGIGSLYYLAYAMTHGLAGEQGAQLTALTLSVVVTSIVLHGLSVTPLMSRYSKRSASLNE